MTLNVFKLDGKIALANKWAKNGVNVNTIEHNYMVANGGGWLTR